MAAVDEEKYAPGTYVLTVESFNRLDGESFTYGDELEIEEPKEVKRLLDSGSVAPPDTSVGRRARAEATNDPTERNRLQAEEKRAQAERLLAEADQLEGEDADGQHPDDAGGEQRFEQDPEDGGDDGDSRE